MSQPGNNPEAHVSCLDYFTTDDGIWLTCSCGFELCMDWSPTLPVANAHWANHLRESETGSS